MLFTYYSAPCPPQFIMSGWGTGYSFHCDLINYDESPQAIRVSSSSLIPRASPVICAKALELPSIYFRYSPFSPLDGGSVLALLLFKVHRDAGHGRSDWDLKVLGSRITASINNGQFFFQVFFVLRKKNSQVTFLHVYHHSIMPFTWWFGVRFAPGRVFFHPFLNIHYNVVYMYNFCNASFFFFF